MVSLVWTLLLGARNPDLGRALIGQTPQRRGVLAGEAILPFCALLPQTLIVTDCPLKMGIVYGEYCIGMRLTLGPDGSNKVLLPAPFSLISECTSPGNNGRLTASSTRVFPKVL